MSRDPWLNASLILINSTTQITLSWTQKHCVPSSQCHLLLFSVSQRHPCSFHSYWFYRIPSSPVLPNPIHWRDDLNYYCYGSCCTWIFYPSSFGKVERPDLSAMHTVIMWVLLVQGIKLITIFLLYEILLNYLPTKQPTLTQCMIYHHTHTHNVLNHTWKVRP